MKARTRISGGIGVIAAVALTASTLSPCSPAEPTPAECERTEILARDLADLLDGAESTGELVPEDMEWAARARVIISRNAQACAPETTTTTVVGQTTTSTTAPATTTTLPHHPPGVPYDEDALPEAQAGWDNVRIVSSPYGVINRNDNIAAFRTSCGMSHMAPDDPIVAPNLPRRSHLHVFFGNTGVDAFSDDDSIDNEGNSTCSGGIANRTGYWVPAMIDVTTGAPVSSFLGFNPPSFTPYGGPGGNEAMQIYYKSGYQGVTPAQIVNNGLGGWFPPGLRMIAGQATRNTPRTESNRIIHYACLTPHFFGGQIGQPSIPHCLSGQKLVMVIRFPQCWNGTDLDPDDHQSHMAYATPGVGCPATHPVPLPEIEEHIQYYVQPGMDTRNWRLATDIYEGPAGYSGHADWWNGWQPDVGQRIIDTCYRPVGLDCQLDFVGNGQRLASRPPL